MSDDRFSPRSQNESDASARFARANLIRQVWDSAGMLVVFLILFTFCSIFIEFFFTGMNLRTSLPLAITTVGIIGCTMLFCLAAGDFDLSVGSVFALSGVVAAIVVKQTHNPFLAVGAGVAVGGVVGLFNGFIIAQLGVNALIATLATMRIARGLALASCDNTSVGISDQHFTALGTASIGGIEVPIWIMIGCFIFFGLLLHRTVFGRNTLAIGGNREAAKLAGIPVKRIKIIIFTMQGMIAGLAGVIAAAQVGLGDPNTGVGIELDVISACVLGGVSLTGGIGTILAVIVGTLIMGTVQNAMALRNIPSYHQYIISGGILLAAVLLDRLKQSRAR